ncbi:MAG: molybdate ABC transporter substrate-binding protein, partial [Ktedonobacteraceae bacterium]
MKNYLRALCLVILCTLLLTACGSATSASVTQTSSNVALNVFAAASLKESFNAIAVKYHQAHPNVTITPSFNGSQILEQQIAS